MKSIFKMSIIIYLLLFCKVLFAQDAEFFKNKYLIVLDVQEGFVVDRVDEIGAKNFLECVNGAIESFNKENVIYVEAQTLVAVLSLKGFSADTLEEREFCRDLKIVNKNIFKKYHGDAFRNEKMVTFLNHKSAKDIVIVGLLAEKCLTNTVLGGLELGYNIYLIPDAILGKNEKSKTKALNKLKNKGAKIIEKN
jgi:nicotinamidase-related amidase